MTDQDLAHRSSQIVMKHKLDQLEKVHMFVSVVASFIDIDRFIITSNSHSFPPGNYVTISNPDSQLKECRIRLCALHLRAKIDSTFLPRHTSRALARSTPRHVVLKSPRRGKLMIGSR